MTSVIFLKVFGDLCVFCAVIASFPALFIHDFLLLVPALLCAAGVTAAVYLRSGNISWAGYAALLIPLASLLLADTLMEYLILTPMLLYTGIVIFRDAFGLEYYTYREQFIHTATLLAVFAAVIFALGYFEGMFSSSWSTYDVSGTLFYGLLFAFTGVFQLRELRMGVDLQPRDRLRSNIQMIVVLGVIIVLTLGILAVEEMMRGSITWLLNTIMGAVGFIPMVLHELIRWFMNDDGGEYMDAVAQLQPTTSEPTDYTYPSMEGSGQVTQVQPDNPWIMAVTIMVLLGFVLIFMLRTLAKTTGRGGSGETVEGLELDRIQTRQPRGSNRSKIRRLYRGYLKMVRRKGQKLRTDQTSQDILNLSVENTDKEASARLRQLYLKARYTDEPITDRDVEEARSALKHADKHHI